MIRNLIAFLREPAFFRIGAVFAFNSILFAFWVTRLPEVKTKLALSEAALGSAFFSMSIGALISMLTISRFIQRRGAGKMTILTTGVFIISMLPPFLAYDFLTLAIALFFAGITMGAMDIAMNTVAASLEKSHNKIIMSTCHGFFSLGGMIGAGLGSLFIAMGVNSVAQISGGIIVLLIFTFFWIRPVLGSIHEKSAESDKMWALPGKALLGLAILIFCSFQGEGAIADWSGVFLKEVAMTDDYMWGLGYAGFSLTMTLGRFSGDELTAKTGPQKVVFGSGFLIVIGLLTVISAQPWLTIIGFTIAGAGYALLVPIVFSEAAKKPGVSPSQGIAAVATFGYTGFLLGPVIIGGIAEIYGFSMGFWYLIVLTLIAVVIAMGNIGKTP